MIACKPRSLADSRKFNERGSGTGKLQPSHVFPEGKSLALTLAVKKETFRETRRNFLAVLASHPELKWRLLKEFWYAGEKVYELYEVDRPRRTELRDVAPQNPLAQARNTISCAIATRSGRPAGAELWSG